MRVVHLSTFDYVGGAARAAAGLHHGLRALGEDSVMLVRERTTEQAGIIQAPRVRYPVSLFWQWLERNCIERNRTSLSNTFFTLGQPGAALEKMQVVNEADVLHLHWVSQFQSPRSLAALLQLGKPLVCTLHDQRAYTGGCHFTAGCNRFQTDCSACPQLDEDWPSAPAKSLRDQRALNADSRIIVVAPSQWMAREAKRSAVFADSRVEVIPYGIDTALFSPLPKAEARRQLGLAEKGSYILFGADAGGEKRKGVHELLAALRMVLKDRKGAVLVLCFGQPHPGFLELGESVKSLGYLKTPQELRRAYAAADLFVLPSLEDNLPNTMLEALGCGTAVVAFATGGVPDVVENGVNGRLVPIADESALAATLSELIADPDLCARLGRTGAKRIASQYSLEVQARSYQELYRSLKPAGSETTPPRARGTGRHIYSAIPALCLQALWREFRQRPRQQG